MSGPSRRGLLSRGLLLLGGAFGIGAATAEAAGTRSAPDVGPRQHARTETLAFAGQNLLLQTPSRRAGERIRPGDRGTVTGQLVDPRAKGTVGSFVSARMAFASGLNPAATADGSVELHTFKLPGGTIMGMGSVLPGETLFAIVGGTGRYAGARGTYVAQQRLREHGGDGTAHFVLKLIA